MTAQRTLFDRPTQKRLSKQCQAILDRLRRSSATNAELAGIALKYTSRISDLREAGHRITCTNASIPDTGLRLYRLEEN